MYMFADVLYVSWAPEIVRNKNTLIIGRFHTSEVRSSKDVRHETSKLITFDPSYAMVPGIVIGLTSLDIDRDTISRVSAFASEIQCQGFKMHIDSWIDTKPYGAGCSWLQVEADDLDFQYGIYNTLEDHPSSVQQKCNTRQIKFKRAYARPPRVVVWLTSFAVGSGSSSRIRSFATGVTEVGFTIHIDTWADSRLYRAAASWIAYPQDRAGIASGSFSVNDLHSWTDPQLYNSAYEPFGIGIFDQPPRTFVALNMLDVSRDQNMRVDLHVDNVSAAGMSWHLNTLDTTILYSAGASYVAFRSALGFQLWGFSCVLLFICLRVLLLTRISFGN